MGDSGDRKRSKKSKRSKRAKKAKLAKRAEQAAPTTQTDQPDTGGEMVLSADSQMVVIEMQRTELSRLLREQQRLNDRVDQLLQLHEREQVLRQQMQAALDKLSEQRALPPPPPPHQGEGEQGHLVERVNRAEGKFAELQSAVGLLVGVLERRAASA
jgi:hypothetical protein